MFRSFKSQEWYDYLPWFCDSLIEDDQDKAEGRLQSMVNDDCCAKTELAWIKQNLLIPIYNGKITINHDELISLYKKINEFISPSYNRNQSELKLLHMTAYACMLALKGLGGKTQSTKFEKSRYKFYTTKEFHKCCDRYNNDIKKPLQPKKKVLPLWKKNVPPLTNIFVSGYRAYEKEQQQQQKKHIKLKKEKTSDNMKGSPEKLNTVRFVGTENLLEISRKLAF